MVFNKLKSTAKERGFTIVELLIVIVVIAILAAITIVAYNGVQQKAKTTQAQTNAVQAQKVAEALNADSGAGLGRYPGSLADFQAGTIAKLPTSLTVIGTTIISTTPNLQTTVSYQYCGAIAAPATTAALGGRVGYWDFVNSAVLYVYTGTGAAALTAGSCTAWVNAA